MGLKLSLIFLVIMGVMAGVFYLYYKDSQKRLAILTENAAKAELAVETQKAAIISMKDSFEKQAVLVNNLQGKLSDAEDGYKKLSSKLRRHDLEELSRAKPGLMEKKINNGTKRLILELEAISGETRSNTTTK
jgi:hypothetical protein